MNNDNAVPSAAGIDFSAPTNVQNMISSDREKRLENLCRRMLPSTNISLLDKKLRQDLLCEFAELRSNGFAGDEVSFTGGKCLFWFDCPLIVSATIEGREGLMMRLDEDEAGFNYLAILPSPRVMNALKEDGICLREACLEEQTMLFLTDNCIEGTASVLRGPIHEHLLPSADLFIAEKFEQEDQYETPGF